MTSKRSTLLVCGRFARRATIVAFASTLVFAGAVFVWTLVPLPEGMLKQEQTPGVSIVDRSGSPLRQTRSRDGSDARWVSYQDIDPDIINAFVAVEDHRFWEHHGVDPIAVVRAAKRNIGARRVVSGASTITMQVARLVRPHKQARTFAGKIAEALWALRIDRQLSKQEILEQYLNRVFLGQATVGVAAATSLYFGSSPDEVSVAQAATLAGIAHAPSRDNPHASLESARSRRNYAIRRMRTLGFVLRDDADRATREPLYGGSRRAPFLAPHFTTRVLAWSGAGGAGGAQGNAGATIHTSIDRELQRVVEEEARHTVDVLRDRDVMQTAAVVLDNQTGEVLAWVGSPDFWSTDDGQSDMVVNRRQPGSALKPFLYGMALDRGFTAGTMLPDIPKSYATATGSYNPRNYDRRFRGPVRAREALASSYNVPAVELLNRVGTASFLETLHLAGFESLDRNAEHYGLGLALGNGDVSLIELANAYRALANGGVWRPWRWRPASDTRRDAVETRRVISPVASAIVLDMLSDPVARIPGFGVSTPFDFPFPVAVKTGTSRHFSDNWAVGTTRGFTVAVWAGNFSGRPMEGVSGVSGAGPLMHRIVMAVAQKLSAGAFTTPSEAGAVAVDICALSGMRATDKCSRMREWFVRGTEPMARDTWERGGKVVLPDEFAEWAGNGLAGISSALAAADADDSALDSRTDSAPAIVDSAATSKTAQSQPSGKFRVISPADGDTYVVPPGIEARYATISLRVAGAGADSVTWTVDGAAITASRWALLPGAHVFAAKSARGDSAVVRIEVRR